MKMLFPGLLALLALVACGRHDEFDPRSPLTVVEKALITHHSAATLRDMTAPEGQPDVWLLFSDEPFRDVFQRTTAEKPAAMARQRNLLSARYDLSDRPGGTKMTRGKALQTGVRVRLPKGVTWEVLSQMAPAEIRSKGLLPRGFLPLPHVKHHEGGMVFPKSHIDEVKRQTGRDLERFDVDFDLPEYFIPETSPAIFLTTRRDAGDVSQGRTLTTETFFDTLDDKLTHKQSNGLRLLVTPFSQQQFNLTSDRRSLRPSLGVSCMDCHTNGHTNAGFHTVGDTKPNEVRNRVDTPSLRGLNIQRLFGSQRALKSVEDFTEFEQRGAYFDGNPDDAVRKGLNPLERGSQVQEMAEMQEILDFPPAPKLDEYGRLIGALATPAEARGEKLFFGKARCAECHTPPHYTDLTMHDLKFERFFRQEMVDGILVKADGPIKTFPLRGIKDSPPYFHDGRLLTLEDTVEFFNLLLQTKLTSGEKEDLVAFMKVL